MPLNRRDFRVQPGPRSVQLARRLVTETVNRLGRAELAETSELGTSELVTNAVLHGEPPITVRVAGTRRHPRVEVRDGSTAPPVVPGDDPLDLTGWDDEEELPVTVGHGLGIVARCADAWGAEIDDTGKVVWFAPAARTHDEASPATISGGDATAAQPAAPLVPFRILGAPLRDLTGFGHHYRELSREVRLLDLAHEGEYPVAHRLAAMFASLERQLRKGIHSAALEEAAAAGRSTVDLTVRLTADGAAAMGDCVNLLDLADRFCHDERLLALARTPAQREFQTWFLTEFARQAGGEQPRPWASDPPPPTQA